jgi:hypothetical protein
MKPKDLISFFIEEAQHCVIDEDRSKNGESTLAVHGEKLKWGQAGKWDKSKSDLHCENCGWDGHTKPNCYSEGGGKEGQGPWQKKSRKGKKKTDKTAAIAKGEDEELFAFTCTSDYVAAADSLRVPKDKCEACVDSGASNHYCLDHTKFQNYRRLINRNISTADGCSLKAVGIGDVPIELPNGSKRTPTLLKNVIFTPDMAFTLISVSRLDQAH